MKIVIDTDAKTLSCEKNEKVESFDLYSKEAFEVLTKKWLKLSWNLKYAYAFTWMGRPIIQLPDDMVRLQEVVYRLKPDVIIETGVAHGGSVIFSASLCKLIGKGRVIGIDIDVRPPNKLAIEAHELSSYITIVNGDSKNPRTVKKVKSLVKEGETVLVILDSNHTKDHVKAELDAYCDLVSPNSYIVATDGIVQNLFDIPRGKADWAWDNPVEAVDEFLQEHPEFQLEPPQPPFNSSKLIENITFWPHAWLKRKESSI